MNSTRLPLPAFFNPKNAGEWSYRPNQRSIFTSAADWKRQHNLKAAATDKQKVCLLLIDVQKDFCFPEGTLYVGGTSGTGAVDDSRRTAEFIYRNLDTITNITTTMDTHLAYQIFSPAFVVDQNGEPLQPFDVITGDLTILRAGKPVGRASVSPAAAAVVAGGNYAELQKHLAYYCKELEKGGKYSLVIWPEHCMLGSDGHALVGVLHEARLFHSYARGSQSDCEIKGGSPYTENYSVLEPEVLTQYNGRPLPGVQKNTRFFTKLVNFDRVIIGGQAGSHCVKSSTEDLLAKILVQDPSLAKKVYVVRDFMSPVTVPDGKGGFIVDNTPQMTQALDNFANAGMHVVSSTTPIEDWPDFMA